MQLLKLVESGNYIFFVSKLFGCFAKMSLDLQILFEVVFTKFVVQFQQIIEFLYVQLVILPKFIHLALRNQFGFVPLLLQLFELCIRFIGIITRFYQFFKFFDNGKLDLQIFFFLTFLLGYKFASFSLITPIRRLNSTSTGSSSGTKSSSAPPLSVNCFLAASSSALCSL